MLTQGGLLGTQELMDGQQSTDTQKPMVTQRGWG